MRGESITMDHLGRFDVSTRRCRGDRAPRPSSPLDPPRRRGACPPELPPGLVCRAGLHDWHVDAELRAKLAGLRPDALELLQGRRRLPRAVTDSALHAD